MSDRYQASTAFLEAPAPAGIKGSFANLGSDHPGIHSPRWRTARGCSSPRASFSTQRHPRALAPRPPRPAGRGVMFGVSGGPHTGKRQTFLVNDLGYANCDWLSTGLSPDLNCVMTGSFRRDHAGCMKLLAPAWVARAPSRLRRGREHICASSRYMTADQLRWQVASGRWQKPARGVVVAQSGPLTYRQALGKLCCAGPRAALAGLTAARLDGSKGFDDKAHWLRRQFTCLFPPDTSAAPRHLALSRSRTTLERSRRRTYTRSGSRGVPGSHALCSTRPRGCQPNVARWRSWRQASSSDWSVPGTLAKLLTGCARSTVASSSGRPSAT